MRRDARPKRRGGKHSISRRPHKQQAEQLRVPDYVALDLETTGLDSRHDRIIEVGAVRFIEGKETEAYSALVNPGRAIPPVITALTGITDSDVAEAPPFVDIFEDLLRFVGRFPICGHQIDFDISFLNEELRRLGKERLINQRLDTAGLSRLLLPRLIGYSLTHVSRHVEVALPKAHRALDDARASGMVAAVLVPKIHGIPVATRELLADFAPRSLLKRLLQSSLPRAAAGKPPQRTKTERFEKLQPAEEPAKLTPDDIEQAFGAGGLGGVLDGFEARSQQVDMAQQVADAFNGNGLLAAEAGTGTGKSLAYLVPAALWAVRSGRRVLVSTHTRNLQDQLAAKDLPVVNRLLGGALRFTALKGRANYLCRNRYGRLLRGELGNLSLRERTGLLPLIRWAEETETGDIEEQRQFNRKWYGKVWNLIAADLNGCTSFRCPLFDQCFVQRARRLAQSSHIVVVNHALFYSDVCAESSVLGQPGPILFDEAHHLEACGHRSLAVVLDSNRINGYLDVCTNLVVRLEKEADTEKTKGVAADLKKRLRLVRRHADSLQSALTDYAAAQGGTQQEYQVAVKPNGPSSLAEAGAFRLVLDELQDALLELRRDVETREDSDDDDTLLADIETCTGQTSQLKADFGYVTAAATEGHVFWIEGNRARGWVKLSGVPLDIGGMLAEVWARHERPVVFTSATLSVAENMSYFTHKIGLRDQNEPRTRTAVLRSPFAAEQSIRTALTAGPEPSSPAFAAHCAETVAMLHHRFKRNILVLFTANAMLRDVEQELRRLTHGHETVLLSQASGTSRSLLLEQFKDSSGAILLGAASFWEGIDAAGEACEMVVMPRLPFQVPTEPLAQALAHKAEEEFGESFYSYSIPEAVIRFRQGAGRLIRGARDRGALIVLDKRIVTKGYGKAFIRSLDGPFEPSDSIDSLAEKLEAFFSGNAVREERYIPFDEA